MFKSRSSRVLLAILAGALVALAGLSGSYVVPLDHDAIQYASRPVTDPVAKLQESMSSGDVTLEYDENMGYLPAVLKALSVPRDLFTPIFAIARVAGWLSHWMEQLKNNRIYRPEQVYVGKRDVPYVPLEKRP